MMSQAPLIDMLTVCRFSLRRASRVRFSLMRVSLVRFLLRQPYRRAERIAGLVYLDVVCSLTCVVLIVILTEPV